MKHHVVDLKEVGGERVDLEGCLEPGEVDFSAEPLRQVELLDWAGSIERTGDEIRFRGALKTRLELACVRCLETIEQPVERAFDLYFRQRDSFVYDEDADIELKEADTQTSFMTGAELPLAGIFREQVLLGIPMKPLCSTDCSGLCPSCGINRNAGSCDCPAQPMSPAFEGLLQLKKRLEERST
jgi:uncharacterized protein